MKDDGRKRTVSDIVKKLEEIRDNMFEAELVAHTEEEWLSWWDIAKLRGAVLDTERSLRHLIEDLNRQVRHEST